MSKFSDSWRTLEPLQKGFLIGLVVGSLVALLARNLVWIAAFMSWGAGIGWLIGRARSRSQRGGSAEQSVQPHPRSGRQDDDEDEDEKPVADSPTVAGHSTVSPPPSPVPVVDREREIVARARDENVLNGVFTLTLYSRRHTGPVHPGQEPIDVHAALGDLHDAAAIDDALLRTEELLAHAADLGSRTRKNRDDQAELQLSHPGFSLEHLSEALNWGYHQGR